MADDLGGEPIPGVADASAYRHPTRLLTPIRPRKRGRFHQIYGACQRPSRSRLLREPARRARSPAFLRSASTAPGLCMAPLASITPPLVGPRTVGPRRGGTDADTQHPGWRDPIGQGDNRHVIANLVQSWAKDIRQHRPEIGEHLAKNFGDNMFGGEFVFSVSREFVRQCRTPLLVMPGDDPPHPRSARKLSTSHPMSRH